MNCFNRHGAFRTVASLCFFLCSESQAVVAGEPLQLTTDHLYKRDPVFIEKGNALVYVVLSRPEQLQLMRMDLKTRMAEPLHPDETRTEFEPAFSPDGRYYAFVQSRSPASVGMVIRDTKTETDADLPPAPGFSGFRNPTFAPSGGRLLYSHAEDGRQQIWSINMQAGDRKNVIDSRGINNWASYSPDGSQILFGSTRDGNFEIYLLDVSDASTRRLTESPSQDIRPRFSPDGRRICFTSSRDGNYEIYILHLKDGQLQRLTNHPERDDYANWHPNGKQIVLVSERRGKQDLYLVDVP